MSDGAFWSLVIAAGAGTGVGVVIFGWVVLFLMVMAGLSLWLLSAKE